MPSFKPKTNKKIKYNKQSAITLDTKHKEFLNEFSKDENDRIPNLKLERQQLKQQLLEEITIEQQLEIKDKINEISEEIIFDTDIVTVNLFAEHSRLVGMKLLVYFTVNCDFIFSILSVSKL